MLQNCKVAMLQSFKVGNLQSYKVAMLQCCRVAKLECCKYVNLQCCKAAMLKCRKVALKKHLWCRRTDGQRNKQMKGQVGFLSCSRSYKNNLYQNDLKCNTQDKIVQKSCVFKIIFVKLFIWYGGIAAIVYSRNGGENWIIHGKISKKDQQINKQIKWKILCVGHYSSN